MTTYTSRQRRLPDDEIIRLYREGLDAESVGFRANCSSATVLDLVRASGEPVRGRGSRPRTVLRLDDAEIVRRYRDGQTAATIAVAAGATISMIYHTLRRLGVTRNRRPDLIRRNRP